MNKEKNQYFIGKVIAKFGDNKYSFENLNYKSQYDKTYVTCLKCNEELLIIPKNFLKSKGCVACCNPSYFNRTKTRTTESFIKECINKYGKNKFDYSLVNYQNSNKNVSIKCNDCGVIREVTPTSFLKNINGCLECSKKVNVKEKKESIKINSLEKFLYAAKNIHGDKYDYSKFEYLGSENKSIIICKEHGKFLQNSHQHISKKGNCPKCAKRKGKDNFIEECYLKHPEGSFDYSKVVYIDSNTKVIIKCLKCNEDFEQTPLHHLRMKNNCCNNCSGKHNYTTKEFIQKSKLKFKNKFDYKNMKYINQNVKLDLKCNDCGNEFKSLPSVHLRGITGGCNICFEKYKLKKYETNFFKEVKKKFGDELDLSMVKYIDRKTNVTLKCKKEGHIFEQTPSSIIFGTTQPCPICSGKRQKNTNEFIKDALKVHGDKYDYQYVDYLRAKSNVDIKCNKCKKVFSQSPNRHLNGSGCPSCSLGGFDLNKPAILYYILIDGKYYKIGITNKSIEERFRRENIDIQVIAQWYYDDGQECYNMEQYYHKEFSWAKAQDDLNILKQGNTELYRFDVLGLDI